MVDRSLSGKEIRAESIRSKHVRGLTLRDLKNGPGPYYLRSAKNQGNGIAAVRGDVQQQRCSDQWGTVAGGIGTYLLGDGPDVRVIVTGALSRRARRLSQSAVG